MKKEKGMRSTHEGGRERETRETERGRERKGGR